MKTKVLLSFVLWQVLFISLLMQSSQEVFLINFELAFLVAVTIIFASYKGYSDMIRNAVHNDMHMEIKDPLEMIEDPYDLYDDEKLTDEEQETLNKQMKKDSFKKMMKAKAGHGSWKRLLAYGFLVLSFMTLKNNDILNIAGFLSGLTLGMIFAGLMGQRLIKKTV